MRFVSAWPCFRRGLPGRYITVIAGSLLHYHFTFTFTGSLFLWPDPAGLPKWRSRSGCYPATCSMKCGLSSIQNVPRSSDQPTHIIMPVRNLVNFSEGIIEKVPVQNLENCNGCQMDVSKLKSVLLQITILDYY